MNDWARVREARRDDSGVTVLELVVAAAILLVSAVSIIGALTFAGTASAQTSMRDRALNLANERIEYARNLQYDDVGTVREDGTYGEPKGSLPDDQQLGLFRVETAVEWADDPDVPGGIKYKNITVTVSWSRPRPGSVRVSSAIYGKSYLINTGVLDVRLRDAETGEPIAGALGVTVYPGDGSGPRTSSAGLYDGNVSFGDLPPGPTSVVVAGNDMYVFDPSETASVTVVPDAVTTVVAMGYRASSVRVWVVDRNGKKVSPAKAWIVPVIPPGDKPHTIGGDGYTDFAGLFKGDYLLTVDAPNRSLHLSTFEITSGGQRLEITVTLADMVLPGTLDVHTVDLNGVPLDGVSVTVYGPAPSTAPVPESPILTVYGESVFNNLALGEYKAEASLEGYASATASATLDQPNKSYAVTLTMRPTGITGSLRVTIHTVDGKPVVGRQVRITYPSGRYVTIATDDNGEALLGNLKPGTYAVRPSGMATTRHDVIVGQETLVAKTASK